MDARGGSFDADAVEGLLEILDHALEAISHSKFAAGPTFAGAENAVALVEFFAGGDEGVGRGGVEFEHFEMARDDHADAEGVGERGGFGTVEIAGDAAFGSGAVDREKRDVDFKVFEGFEHAVVTNGVAAVIDGPWAELNDVAEVMTAAGVVTIDFFVGGGDGVDGEAVGGDGFVVVEADGKLERALEAVGDKFAVGFGND